MIELTIAETLWLAGATLLMMLATAVGFYSLGRRVERRCWHDFAAMADGELRRRRQRSGE